MELIRYDSSTGKFQVGDAALSILKALKGPVSVVAVCGRARQGKSFILNQLLQVTGGFQIGSTTRPCTKGLWMWSSPQRTLDDAGKEYHIVRGRCLLPAHSNTPVHSTPCAPLPSRISVRQG